MRLRENLLLEYTENTQQVITRDTLHAETPLRHKMHSSSSMFTK